MHATWVDINEGCERVRRQIVDSGWTPDYVVAVGPDGLVAAALLCAGLAISRPAHEIHTAAVALKLDAGRTVHLLASPKFHTDPPWDVLVVDVVNSPELTAAVHCMPPGALTLAAALYVVGDDGPRFQGLTVPEAPKTWPWSYG